MARRWWGRLPLNLPAWRITRNATTKCERIAAELWGDCDGESLTENQYGKGKVVWGKPLVDVLADMERLPDFACQEVAVSEQIRYIHRTVGE